MQINRHCAALMIAAPASGQGKTSLTAALARFHSRAGKRVRVFKIGPDFIDPMLLEAASGHPVYQLDEWMMGEAECQTLLSSVSQTADLILFESVMGAFDGTPNSVDLAKRFGIPVLFVIDASAMAETFGAIAEGLMQFDSQATVFGVVANRIRSSAHADMLHSRMKDSTKFLGWVPPFPNPLPERHLGLLAAEEIGNLESILDEYAESLGNTLLTDFEKLPRLRLTEIEFSVALTFQQQPLKNKRIAIAKDSAFRFIYWRNIECLQQLGAEVVFFSPLKDPTLLEADAYYFPGGYPELYAAQLAANTCMLQALRDKAGQNLPIFAECGGMMYLFNQLVDLAGVTHHLVGLLAGGTVMQTQLVNLAYQQWKSPVGEIRGHSFHYSRVENQAIEHAYSTPQRYGQPEALFRQNNCIASYVHWYFFSNPTLVATIFNGELQ